MYTPEEAAQILGRDSGALTANWFKEKARYGLIPCTRIGRAVLFTAEDLAEIARMGRQRTLPSGRPARPAARRRPAGEPKISLEAKTPRRLRNVA